MEDCDFVFKQYCDTYYFKHKVGSIFYYRTGGDWEGSDSLYDFKNLKYMHDPELADSQWIEDAYPLSITEYKKWLFRQELKEVLDKAE